jgi:hypothetical protein
MKSKPTRNQQKQVATLAYSSTLKMEAAWYSETLVDFY